MTMKQTVLRRFLWRQDLTPFVPSRCRDGRGSMLSSLVGGRRVAGGGASISIESPSDGRVVTDMRAADASDVNFAVACAREAVSVLLQHAGSVPHCEIWSQRSALLTDIAEGLAARSKELAVAEALCSGMCLRDAIASVNSSIDCFRWHARLLLGEAEFRPALESAVLPKFDNQHLSSIAFTPVGVVALVTPFNYPLEMFAWKASSALAAGNAVIWKPPEAAPMSSWIVADIIIAIVDRRTRDGAAVRCAADAALRGTVQILQGGSTVGHELAAHPDVDMIAFTGSVKVGKSIQVAAAQSNLKRVQLELGGNAAVIVAKSAAYDDHVLATTVVEVAMQCFSNSGQSCTSSRRIFIPRTRLVPFLNLLKSAIQKRKLGHALDPNVEQGPLISAASLDRAMTAVASATKLQRGVRLVTGGFRPPFGAGHFMAPTVLVCDDATVPIVAHELFAPVMCVVPYDDAADVSAVVHRANATMYGLSASVISVDAAETDTCVNLLAAGTVWHNCVDAMSGATPFGGWKQSGYGTDLGAASIRNYSNTKVITRRVPPLQK